MFHIPKRSRIDSKAELGMAMIAGIISLILILGIAGVIISWNSTAPGQPSDVGTASYTIFKDDFDLTCAVDGTTKEVEYRSGNSSAVFQQVIDQLAARNGGLIAVRSGLYNISYQININWHGIQMVGENSVLSANGGTVFSYTGTESCIYVGLNSYRLQRDVIKDIAIMADGAAIASGTAYGMKIDTVESCIVDHVVIRDFGAGTGIFVTCRGGTSEFTADVMIRDSFFYSNLVGIYLDGYSAPYHEVNTASIDNCVVIGASTSTGIGISIGHSADRTMITGGDVENYDVAIGIYGDNSNLINTRTESIGSQHLQFSSTTDNTLISGHLFVGSGAYVSGTGSSSANTTYIGCVPWTTVNSGSALISGTTGTFAHGLGYGGYPGSGNWIVPSIVSISFNSTAYGSYSWSADATNIIVVVANTGDYTFYWEAKR